MSIKKLILTIGLPRSGKTTWAKKQNAPIVNPDSIRLALHGQRFIKEAEPFVWAIAYLMVTALFKAGHEVVIVDATNITQKRRQPWIDKFSNEYELEWKVISTTKEECIERANQENDLIIIPVIEKMAKDFEQVKL
jgi:predicted kinase